MADDSMVPRTRRGLLAGALGGLVAWAASAVGRTVPVRADNDNPVVLGQTNTETKATRILNSGTGDVSSAFEAWDAGETYGGGFAAGGSGVSGENQNPGGLGVWARSQGDGTGVLGWSQLVGTEFGIAIPMRTGVYGRAIQDSTSVGVLGESNAGLGVRGQATTGTGVRAIATTGTAVYATTANAKSGTALRTIGRVRFDNSVGLATVLAGKSSVVVTPGIDLTSTSAVVATLQANPTGSITVQGVTVSTTTNTFTIHLTTAAASNLKIAWHVFG